MYCRNCDIELGIIRHGTFCSQSCRASFTNKHRKKSAEHNIKISMGVIKSKIEKRARGTKTFPVRLDRIEEPFSRIYINVCAHCDDKSISRIKRKYCDEHIDLYHRKERERFAFTFRLENYPQLFNIENIRKIGLYHPKKNVDGLLRDHRISINDAIKYRYDPFYIKHPLNCMIMTQRENSSKNIKSSISYNELKSLVNEFEMAPVPGIEPGFGD